MDEGLEDLAFGHGPVGVRRPVEREGPVEDAAGGDGACVARLRAIAGTAPDAPDLTNLVGELLLKSPDFAGLWERYEVTGRKPAHKIFHHPQVGTLTLTSQSLHVEGTPGQRIGVYTADPGSPDHDALLLLDMSAPSVAMPSTTPRY